MPIRGRPPGQTARYKLVLDDLKRRIGSGEWSEGRRWPSSRDLAERYQISRRMISVVLGKLAQEGLLRVTPRRIPVAVPPARLKPTFSNGIAVVSTASIASISATGGYWEQIRTALIPRLQAFSSVLFFSAGRWRTDFPVALRELPLAGVLLIGPLNRELLYQYAALKTNVVLLDQPAEGMNLHFVAVDNLHASADATARLIRMGHRRIAFVRAIIRAARDIDPDSRERAAGFEKACIRHRLRPDQYAVFTTTQNAASMHTPRKVIDALPRFSAVITANPNLAASIQACAKAKGIRVPEDLSIVTFCATNESRVDWTGHRVDFGACAVRGIEIIRRQPSTLQRIRLPTTWCDGQTLLPADPGQ